MVGGSRLYRFLFGRSGDGTGIPFVFILAILVPFLIIALFFQEDDRNKLRANPGYTYATVERISSTNGSQSLHYHISVGGAQYKGSGRRRGLSVGDSIEVAYQKDQPENNITVYDLNDTGDFSYTIIFIIMAIIYGIYRWRKTE